MPDFYTFEDKIVCGCDEAGRGCLAGPVVAAAVILPQNYYHPLLNDSKQVKEGNRNELRLIIENDALAFGVGIVSHQEIDQINILKASFLAMHRAIDQLSISPEWLIIDGNKFAKYKNISHHCVVKGDSKYTQISAASILAKTYRDEYMDKIALEYPQYAWEINKGYPTVQHREAIKIHGPSPHHRMTFKLLPSEDSITLFDGL